MPQIYNNTDKPIDVIISVPGSVPLTLSAISPQTHISTAIENADGTVMRVYSQFLGKNILTRHFAKDEIQPTISVNQVSTFNLVNPLQNNILGNTLQFIMIHNQYDISINVNGNIIPAHSSLKYYGRDAVGIQRGTVISSFITKTYQFADIVLTGNVTDILYGDISTFDLNDRRKGRKMFITGLTRETIDNY